MGLGFTIMALVGNSIGEGNKKKAQTYAKITGGVMMLLSLLLAVIMMVFRYQIARMFTPTEEVINLTAMTFLVTGVMFFTDGINC